MSTNRYPLVLDKDNQRIRELPSGDNLNLQGSSISAVQNIVPEGNGQYDLGADANRWGDLYLSGTTIFLGNGEISFTAEDGFVFTSNGTPISIGYDSSDFSTDFSTKTTDDLTQGSTNKYYANSLVDSHLSGGTGITYSNGVISIDSATQSEIAGKANDADISVVGKTGSYNDLLNKPDLSALEEVFSFANLTAFPATGETNKVYISEDTGYVYRWSGSEYIQLTDQTAIWGQIGGTLSNQTDLNNALNTKLESSDIADFETTTQLNNRDTANRNRDNHTGTQAISTIVGLQDALNDKQDELVSGTNVKTINNQSILGEGNIDITSAEWGNIAGTLSSQTDLQGELDLKVNKSGDIITGSLGIGGDTTGIVNGNTVTAKMCVKQDDSGPVAGFVKAGGSSAARGATVYICRSRGTIEEPTSVQEGDTLSTLVTAGHDGTDIALAAAIEIQVDGTPANDSIPGRIVFNTTSVGSNTHAERVRITESGNVGIGTNNPSEKLEVEGNVSVSGDLIASNATFNSTGAMTLPVGTTAQRPASPVTGMFRFNTSIGKFEGYDGVEWVDLRAPADPNDFTGEGDLETQSGTEDLEEGTGTIDLMN